MSCIDVQIKELGSSHISVTANAISGVIDARVENLNQFAVNVANAISEGLLVSIDNIVKDFRIGVSNVIKKHLDINCSIVCSLEQIKLYLDVTPADIQWITDDIGVYFDVHSNTDWIITTE